MTTTLADVSTFLDRAIVAGLLVAVVFTALAFGTVEVWAVAIYELTILVLIVCWLGRAIIDRHITLAIPALGLPILALVILGAAQSLAILRDDGTRASLSQDVDATRTAVTVISFLFISFVLAANSLGSPERVRSLAIFLVVYGLVLAVFAIVQHMTWTGKLYWLRPVTAGGAGYGGPFVNRNHFAGYMEMLIPMALAMSLAPRMSVESRLFYGFSAVMMVLAHFGSLSRGGMISLGAGLLFVIAMSRQVAAGARTSTTLRFARGSKSGVNGSVRRVVTSPFFVTVVIGLVVVSGIVWIDADTGLLSRLANDPLSGGGPMSRRGIWSDTLSMIKANGLLGVGLGAYKTVFPIWGHGDGSLLVDYSHNDYLQLAADCGLIGGVIGLCFVIAAFRALVRCLRSGDKRSRAIALGSAGGMFAILVHSLFDFNLQIPSNALLFLILTAIVSRVGTNPVRTIPAGEPASDLGSSPGFEGVDRSRLQSGGPALKLVEVHYNG